MTSGDNSTDPRSVTWFKPGQSGNPSGRPKLPEELKGRLRDLSDKAVDTLAAALGSDDERIRVHAASQILDRAYGKPAAAADLTLRHGPIDLASAHLEELKARMMRRSEPE